MHDCLMKGLKSLIWAGLSTFRGKRTSGIPKCSWRACSTRGLRVGPGRWGLLADPSEGWWSRRSASAGRGWWRSSSEAHGRRCSTAFLRNTGELRMMPGWMWAGLIAVARLWSADGTTTFSSIQFNSVLFTSCCWPVTYISRSVSVAQTEENERSLFCSARFI